MVRGSMKRHFLPKAHCLAGKITGCHSTGEEADFCETIVGAPKGADGQSLGLLIEAKRRWSTTSI